ncbi:MAG: hypothetical protein LC796_12055 [Acidobacteria bacterium]|nr:hypothetical protein [Acidobacteriota bacterium]MCA1610854.1 hypothetical protein [Acidobacteriota bacterium]
MSALLAAWTALFSILPGEVSAVLLLFAIAVVVVLAIDDDDLPGPRLCRIAASRA